MTKRMLIDATHPEETRVAVVDGTRLEEFDFEIASRRQIKSNIYLAKTTRVEPSLQAAFVEYGGNRHGFLPFPEIHPDYYRIPIGDRQMLGDDHSDDRHDHHHDDQDEGPVAAIEALQPESFDPAPAPSPEQDTSEAAPETAEPAPHTYEAAAPADPVLTERVYEGEGFEPAPEQPQAQSEFGSEFPSQSADGETASEAEAAGPMDAPAAEPVIVETVGGDEVEDAQRRRRSQMPHYKIQEVIKRRQIMLVQVSKEERGNKGAAVTTFLSLPGRYCVLMPNTSRGGGVSRKIANPNDRKRMKELISDLEVPDGMSVILRTAGVERSKAEIKRDLEYLLRLWENIRRVDAGIQRAGLDLRGRQPYQTRDPRPVYP